MGSGKEIRIDAGDLAVWLKRESVVNAQVMDTYLIMRPKVFLKSFALVDHRFHERR